MERGGANGEGGVTWRASFCSSSWDTRKASANTPIMEILPLFPDAMLAAGRVSGVDW